jgi:hypothetical protein
MPQGSRHGVGARFGTAELANRGGVGVDALRYCERAEARSLAETKQGEIEARIAELTALQDEMRTLIEQCRASGGDCPIIRRSAD